MKTDKFLKFKHWDCKVIIDKYPKSNQPYISLIDVEDGSPIATASLNLPDYPLLEGCVFIKNYSENKGILEALQNGGIISDTIVEYPLSQFVNTQMCALLI